MSDFERLALCYGQICALLGFLVSGYALYVEAQHEANPFYVALCDINSWIACSKVSVLLYVWRSRWWRSHDMGGLWQVFASEYGRVMGKYVVGMDSPLNQPNAFYGTPGLLALCTLLAFLLGSPVRVAPFVVLRVLVLPGCLPP